MGAITFTTTSKSTAMLDAFYKAVELADQEEYEYSNHDEDDEDDEGNDDDCWDASYNGTISTTEFVKDATQNYLDSGKTLEKFIEDALDNNSIDKRECWGIETEKGNYVFFGWAAN